MTLDDILPAAAERFHNNPLDVDLVEQILGARFPVGYREFIARLGGGVLADFLRIFPPRRILYSSTGVEGQRHLIDEHWFWQQGAPLLAKTRGVETILLADTKCGAELIFHLSTPDRIYALSGDDDKMIYVAGDGFMPALEWVLTSGVLVEPGRALRFQPMDFKCSSVQPRRQR
jgi:hypothetical protein